jgi:DNA-binding NtrC family response regulator
MGLLKDNSYFLMITEPRLTKISGFKLLKYASDNLPAMLLALLSTEATSNTRGIMIQSRVDFYIEKPIETAAVEDVLLMAKEIRDRLQ